MHKVHENVWILVASYRGTGYYIYGSGPGGCGGETRRGKSGLLRAGRSVTPTEGNLRESATEKKPPAHAGKGEMVG